MTKLHEAAHRGDTAAITRLIAAGANPNTGDEVGQTPLHVAVLDKRPEIIRTLLELGAEVDARNEVDQTPLSLAARNNSIIATEILLELGADPTASDDLGRTPLHQVTLWNGQAHIAARLIETGGDVNAADEDGQTPLHMLCCAGAPCFNPDLTDCLLEAEEADLEVRNQYGHTPLHEACMTGRIHMARALIRAGADVNATDNGGKTPLYWASKRENIAMHPLLAELNTPASAPPTPTEPDTPSM